MNKFITARIDGKEFRMVLIDKKRGWEVYGTVCGDLIHSAHAIPVECVRVGARFRTNGCNYEIVKI